jgi:phosphate transport system substrate-binding protein
MSDDSNRGRKGVSRRKFIAATGAASAAAIAGCSGGGGGDGDDGGDGGDEGSDPTATATETATETEMEAEETTEASTNEMDTSALESGGSSTVYPISNTASSYWNANRPASDTEYWPQEEYGFDTDLALADYFGSLYGFDPEAGKEGAPPFRWTVGLSHSGTGVRKVRDGLYDIGNSSGNVEDELPDRDSYEKFVDHVTGVDGQPITVSSEIAEAGVDGITGDQLKGIYKGEISNWSEIGGPDREILVLGRVTGSGTRTAFVSNVWGNPKEETTVDNRYGQNQRLAAAIAQADNAISYLALAFLDTDGVTPISLEWEGTTYSYQDDENGLDSAEYPLSRDLHMYTWDGTSNKEAAAIYMCLTDFGQDRFVAPNDYFTLGERRRQEQLAKLPDQVN